MKILWHIACFVFVILTQPALFAGETKLKIAAADFGGEGVSPLEAVTVTNFFRSGLISTNQFTVLERQNMEQILAEQEFQMSGCTQQECAVQMGKLLNVEKIVLGTVTRFGPQYYIHVRLVDVETGEITHNQRITCKKQKQLPDKAEKLAFILTESITGKRKTNYLYEDSTGRVAVFFGAKAPFLTGDPISSTIDTYYPQLEGKAAKIELTAFNPELGFRYLLNRKLSLDVAVAFPQARVQDKYYIYYEMMYNGSSLASGINTVDRILELNNSYIVAINYNLITKKRYIVFCGIGGLLTTVQASLTSNSHYVYDHYTTRYNLLPGTQTQRETVFFQTAKLGCELFPAKTLSITPSVSYMRGDMPAMYFNLNTDPSGAGINVPAQLLAPKTNSLTFEIVVSMYL